jgi:acyl-CoA synthetase (AMP-forming)/AMP-acid ligase II/1-acyl-sn-glycerol-3-phosphate acyltransferase/acyl carrier protein
MINTILRAILRSLLWLRYRIRIVGLAQLEPQDNRGILFLPNHPALIDPIIMMVELTARFRVGVLADKAQLERPVIGLLAKRVSTKAILDPAKDRGVRGQIEQQLGELTGGLNQGQAFLVYPAGRTYRQSLEDLGSNSAVETIVHACPDIRIVMVRTRGLWGSSFSRASGRVPSVVGALKCGLLGLLKSGLLFGPRRTVSIEFFEPMDFPRDAERSTINRYLERFYNENATGNTYVPYSIWERGGIRVLPDPPRDARSLQEIEVPPATRAIVESRLRELTGQQELKPDQRLAHDLGLDSLSRVGLQAFIESEFGFPQSDGDSLETVGDLLIAACGEGSRGGPVEMKPVDAHWFVTNADRRLEVAPGTTITEVFLAAAHKNPGQIVVADQTSGARSYRALITGILVLKEKIRHLDGEHIGIMLPASVAATVAYMSTLFAGKTPVMLNWTTGPRGVEHCLEHLGICHVLSARPLLERLKSEGFDKATRLLGGMTYLDDVVRSTSLLAKLKAALLARISWASLRDIPCPEVAVVLFTSGSENLPKAVPLLNSNMLTNIRDVIAFVSLQPKDALLAILPPFHSFGLTVDLVLPLITGLRAVFHPNPTESAKLVSIIELYRASLLVGTPTFLGGIVNSAHPSQLASLRLAVTGAEQCPPRVYDVLAKRCPQTKVLEGYGITECSPIVSVNRPGREQRETIGELVPSLECALVDPDTLEPVPRGQRGLLLVRGPSVFGGYLRHQGESPFVEYEGHTWYRTGDLVLRNDNDQLVFCGRLKRFVKIGGEMISLPAIESVLERVLNPSNEDGPTFAVEAIPGEHPELVLFTTTEQSRTVVNRYLRDAGLSPLHNIRQIRRVESMPLLGSGKTDYRTLKGWLVQNPTCSDQMS